MRLLITGGAGFIGSHVVRHWLERHPADEVVNLDVLSYAGSQAAIEELARVPNHRFIQGDIADPAVVKQAMEGCELVVHFAAETHVDRSITNAAPFLRTNVEGTQVLLHHAVHLGLPRFIHMSTDEVYGPIAQGAHAESAPFNPRSPYAASKAAGDLLVRAYQETYGLSAVIVRCTNVYGPRQFPEKFIPLCITNALTGQPLPLYGDGLQRRGWLFIDDCCRAIECLITQGVPGMAYNISSPWERANVEAARMILRVLEQPSDLIRFVPDRPGHDRRYAMDGARLAALGWRPEVPFDDGLRTTIAWYQQHAAWWRPLKERLREDPYHWLNRPPGSGTRQAARAVV